MKNIAVYFISLFFISGVSGYVYAADDGGDKSRHHDADSDRDDAEPAVRAKLKDQYHLNDAQIDTLRDKKFGYGEIRKVYEIAGQMPGGATPENVNKVVEMRLHGSDDHKTGWGNVGRELGVKQKRDSDIHKGGKHGCIHKDHRSHGSGFHGAGHKPKGCR